jgi:hypothetical protein
MGTTTYRPNRAAGFHIKPLEALPPFQRTMRLVGGHSRTLAQTSTLSGETRRTEGYQPWGLVKRGCARGYAANLCARCGSRASLEWSRWCRPVRFRRNQCHLQSRTPYIARFTSPSSSEARDVR